MLKQLEKEQRMKANADKINKMKLHLRVFHEQRTRLSVINLRHRYLIAYVIKIQRRVKSFIVRSRFVRIRA